MGDRVTCAIEDGVADVRLARPAKMNALDPAMFEAIRTVGEALLDDDSVRAVVLSGEGRAFCSGLDVESFAAMTQGVDRGVADLLDETAPGGTTKAQQMCWVWQELPVPVIAAIHGVAFGGGLQLALAADIRYAAPDAQLSVLEVQWGLVPDMTGSQLLGELIGRDHAKELVFTGRKVSGEEAAALGLVTRVTAAPYRDAHELAAEIAARSPDAVRRAKELLNMAGRTSLADGFRAEARHQATLIGSPDQMEAVRAAFEGRPPRFGA